MPDYKSSSIVLICGVLISDIVAKLRISKGKHVVVLEGRPSLESAKENAQLFLKNKIVPTVIADSMAGYLFENGYVHQLVLACQYVDNSGALCDTGALIYAILAKKHKVPILLVQSKRRTRFLGDPKSILSFEGQRTAPKGALGYVPLVEWVPAKYLNARKK